jgi:Domain of unknown function (DUF5666)
MKYTLITCLTILLAAPFVLAVGDAPTLIQAGIYPATVHAGEEFTVYAQLSDPQGAADMEIVGLVYDNQLVLELPASDTEGLYYKTLTAPSDLPDLDLPMFIGAVDRAVNVSNFIHFDFFTRSGNWPGFDHFQRGTITEINSETMQIVLGEGEQGVTVQVTSETRITDAQFNNLEFEDLEVGMKLIVYGEWIESVFTAQKILVLSGNPGSSHLVRGPINEIIADEMQLMVGDVRVQVNSETSITDITCTEINFDDLEVGMKLFVLGDWTDEIFTAKRIFVLHEFPGFEDKVLGRINEINTGAMQLVVDETTVQVTSETNIISFGGGLGFDDLEVGMRVLAMGEGIAGTFTAKRIFVWVR